MTERMDYVAIKDGNAYALMSADNLPADEVASFYRQHAEADEIKLMPVSKAVELHLQYLKRREHARQIDRLALEARLNY